VGQVWRLGRAGRICDKLFLIPSELISSSSVSGGVAQTGKHLLDRNLPPAAIRNRSYDFL
jgi:hypothetical protein